LVVSLRSFVFIPTSGPIGVLNIHRIKINILEEKEPAKQFTPQIIPFTVLSYDLLINLSWA